MTKATDSRLTTNPDEVAYRLGQVYRLLLTLGEQPVTDVARLNNQDAGHSLDEDSLAQMQHSLEDPDETRKN